MFVFINKNTMNNIKSYTSRFNSLLEYKTGDIKPLLNEGFDQAAMTQMIAKSNELLGGAVGSSFDLTPAGNVKIISGSFVSNKDGKGLFISYRLDVAGKAGFTIYLLPDPKNNKVVKIADFYNKPPLDITSDNLGKVILATFPQINLQGKNSIATIQKLVPIVQNAANVYATQGVATAAPVSESIIEERMRNILTEGKINK
jgi:hypothetical protein